MLTVPLQVVFQEFLGGADDESTQNGGMATTDWCRHCESVTTMTLEHVPPRSAGNDEPFHRLDDTGAVLQAFEDGHAIPTLCEACNGGASERRLPAAYKLWREEVISAIESTTATESAGKPFNIWRTNLAVSAEHGYALHPGRIARQILGMVLAIQDNPSLLARYPELRNAYFSTEGTGIGALTLHVALANTDFRYFTSEVASVSVDLRTASSEALGLHVWCFAPFLVALVQGEAPPWASLRIDPWLALPANYHFRKRDRTCSYPIADRSNLLVQMMYQGGRY